MNAITEEFINYIKTISIFSKLNKCRDNEIEIAITQAIFKESEKRRMNESEKGLLFDAVLSVVKYNQNEFDDYRAKLYRSYNPLPLSDEDHKTIANEISEMMNGNELFKRTIESWLCSRRKDIFENEYLYTKYLDDVLIQDHPMMTFGRNIDYIERCKGLPEYLILIERKQNLINLVRVGNAVLPRHEWKSKVIIRPTVPIPAKNQNLALNF